MFFTQHKAGATGENGEETMRILSAGNEGSLSPHLEIRVLDEPGSGGAHHEYEVWLKPESGAPRSVESDAPVIKVSFQNGPIATAQDANGGTNEALLAIVIDRLQCFSKGPYPSRETSIALTKCQEALHWMEHRTKERAARGVEGKHAA